MSAPSAASPLARPRSAYNPARMTDGVSQPRTRWLRAGGLLLVGVVATIGVGGGRWGNMVAWGALVAAIIVGTLLSMGGTRDKTMRTFERIAHPSPKAQVMIGIILTIGAGAYLLETAVERGRGFGPVIHDEHANITATRMLAGGHLWLPHHPMGDFFDSFHLITDRVYASKYGPGTAMFCAPAVWLHVDLWLVPLILSAMSVGLFYAVLCEMFDGLAGLLGALMLPAMSALRRVSIEVLSEGPMLFLAMLLVLAVLKWRKSGRWGWVVAMGMGVGWGGLTRPVDAGCLAVFVAVGMAFAPSPARTKTLMSGGENKAIAPPPLKRWATFGAMFLSALPFLVIQLIANHGITGNWMKLPWTYYSQRNDPYDRLGGGAYDPAVRTKSVVPAMQKFEREITVPEYLRKVSTPMVPRLWHHSLRPTLQESLPHPLLMLLVPVGLLKMGRERWVWPGAFVLFALIYSRHTFFLNHYAVTMAPGIIILVLAGWEALAHQLANARARIIGAFSICAITLTAYPQFRFDAPGDEWDFAPIMRLIDIRLDELERKPAVVLLRVERFTPHLEPVYNVGAAWPDDAKIVRAHDLGERNRELFGYYADRAAQGKEAERAVYLYTVNPEMLQTSPTYLGTVSELARQ